MAERYENLTGRKLISAIRRKNIKNIFAYGFMLLLGIAFFVFAVYKVKEEHSYGWAIAAVLLGILFCVLSLHELLKCFRTLKSVPNCRLFRKYGNADTIAQVISEYAAGNFCEPHNMSIVTEKFIMAKKNYESYVPLSSVLQMYKQINRTNGVLTGYALVIVDEYGDKYRYPFQIGKRYSGDLELAAGEIAKRAPRARFDCTAEATAYVRENQKQLP